MNELKVISNNGQLYTDSREVAKMVGKAHKNLIRDVDGYLKTLTSSKLSPLDFFAKSTYTDAKGESRPCYLLTKKGCEFVANKLTGEKGTLFTASYINAFHRMEDTLKGISGVDTNLIKAERAKAMLINAKTKAFKALMSVKNDKQLSDVALRLYGLSEIENITGEKVDKAPEVGKIFTATEIGNACHVNAQKVGKVAKANNLQTEEYGIWVLDKSPYSAKQVRAFRYNEKGKAKLKELLLVCDKKSA